MIGYTGPNDPRNAPMPPHGWRAYLRLLWRHVQNDWRRYRTHRSGRCPECGDVLTAQSRSLLHPGKGCPNGHVFYARRYVRPRVAPATVEDLIAEIHPPRE